MKKSYSELTDNQQLIVNNLANGKEIYYDLEGEDIKALVEKGWLTVVNGYVRLVD